MSTIKTLAQNAREGANALAAYTSAQKNEALSVMAAALKDNAETILEANAIDMKNAAASPKHMLDRLSLSKARIASMADGLMAVRRQKDPVGTIIEEWDNYVGLHIRKLRVPFGVVGIIYEARPNVTADAMGLCFKSGNAVILRGGRDAINSNRAIVEVLKKALTENGFDSRCVQFVDDTSHKTAEAMMRARGLIDLLIPRGSAALINSVIEKATVPVIETGTGNCHAYVHEKADANKALEIIINGKIQRPSVCNALESLIVDEAAAKKLLPQIYFALKDRMVEMVGCARSVKLCPGMKAATEEDYYAEYLALKMSVKIVKNIDEAIAHINKYGTHHSDVIITENGAAAARFQKEVDSAAVYVNASTRFTDGGEFGMGAEMGISTQKLHARGPMGLRELTTYKFTVTGNGQIRG